MNGPDRFTIAVDVHEEASGIARTLAAWGLSVDVVKLPVGDYSTGGILVERKQVLDLHKSLLYGRFWRQVGALRLACEQPYLLIEGSDIYDGPLRSESVRGAYLAVTEQRISIIRSSGATDSARWLRRLALRVEGTRACRDRPPYAQHQKSQTPATAAEAALAAIPFVSTKSARSLLAHFGSVAAVARADERELMAVTGVGARRARAIVDTLQRHVVPI